MTARSKKKLKPKKHDIDPAVASSFMAAALLLCVVVASDTLFASTEHVAMYGALPSVSTSDYTPVQKSSVSSKTNTASARAAARSRASALTHAAATSSSSSSSIEPLVFDAIDGSNCTDNNPSGCRDLVNALANKGNPACLRLRACRDYLNTAGNTVECYHNKTCYRAVLAMDRYDKDASRCISNPAPCRKDWDNIMKALDAIKVTPLGSESSVTSSGK